MACSRLTTEDKLVRMTGIWGPVVAVAGISLVLGVGRAQAQRAAPDSASLTPALVDAGRKIFHGRGSCHACHGDKLQGGPIAPALLGPTWRHIDGSFASIVDRIEKGQAGTVMMPRPGDRKSTRLNSSHVEISYAVF